MADIITPSGLSPINYPVEPAGVDPASLGLDQTGWKWDERYWFSDTTENWAGLLTANWDPTSSGIPETYFQPGIGDNQDIEYRGVVVIPNSGLRSSPMYNIWAPELNHGYYYDFAEEHYLFSDDSEIQYPTFTNTTNDLTHIVLGSRPKAGIPIMVEQFSWDEAYGEWDISQRWRKRVNFTGVKDVNNVRQSTYDSVTEEIVYTNIDDTEPEFIVLYSGIDAHLYFNSQVVTEVGNPAVDGIEIIGITTGDPNEEFRLTYSPIDITDKTISIISSIAKPTTLVGSGIVSWTPIAMGEEPVGYQVIVDSDLGTVRFGDPDKGANIPIPGSYIAANYWKTVKVEFEPEFTRDTITGIETNINPIYRRSGQGFVYLSNRFEDPASIELRADLPVISDLEDIYGPLNIGNSFAGIIATVKDRRGRVLEDQTVTFYITSDPAAGSFGTINDSSMAITDQYGEAITYYHPPRSITEIGEDVTASGWSDQGSTVTLSTSRILIEGNAEDIFLYKVLIDDASQGILTDLTNPIDEDVQLEGYYTNFFTEQGINNIPTLPIVGEGFLSGPAEWEAYNRLLVNLPWPRIFEENQGLGRRVIVAAHDDEAINPHTFTSGCFFPVQPIEVNKTTEGYDLVFDTTEYSIPEPLASKLPSPSGDLYAYFVVAPTRVKLIASVYNERLNRTIYSNEIQIKLEIPAYMNGVWTVDTINQIHIDEISPLVSGLIAGQRVPLGWRLRSTNVGLAGALGGVTFLDINTSSIAEDEPDFNPDRHEPDEYWNVLTSGIVASGIM